MKKIVKLLIIILCFYFVLNFFLGKTNDLIQYKIKDFSIKEFHYEDTYFEIDINGQQFNFWTFNKLKKKTITDIKYYTDNEYKCILPIFKNDKIYTDIICLKNDIQYLYNTMDNKTINLTNFRNELSFYKDLPSSTDSLDFLTINKNNFLENKYLVINSYKGLYILTKNGQKEIELFNNDIYNQEIKGLVNKYYIIADYNQEHDFSDFFIIDIENGKKSTLKTNYSISLDSIVQGIYENCLYVYDIDSKRQYKIDPEKKNVSIVGNEKKGIKIYDEKLNTYKTKEVKDFKFKSIETIDKYDLLGMDVNTYYYSLNNSVYKAHKNSINKLTYLFKNTYETIKHSKDYLCFLDTDTIYCYNEVNGIKEAVKSQEFHFNKNLTFEVYSK